VRFTPGPWWNESGVIHAKDPKRWTPEVHSCVHVAKVSDVYWESPDEEAEVNAQLISAAPDMYEACKHAVSVFNGRKGLAMEEQFALDRIYRALLKAEGKVVD